MMARFDSATDLARQAAVEEVNSPVRPPSVHSDVLVPMYQAIVSGLFVAIVVGAALKLLLRSEWEDVGTVAALLFAVVGVAVWFWRMGWAASTIERLEQRTGLDLNQDGHVEPPHAYTVNRTQKERRDPVALERARLGEFIEFIYAHGTAIRALRTGFNEQEIARFQSLLMRPDVGVVGWLNPRNHNQGWRPVVTHDKAVEIVGRLNWEPTKGRTA